MKDVEIVCEYATEGSPLFIGDLLAAANWRGCEPDTKGVLVEYMGHGVDKLPDDLVQTREPGRQLKKFKTLAEAVEFEQRVIAALMALNPGAARDPKYPDHPGWYENKKRVFSVEKKYGSAFSAMLKKLKGSVLRLPMGGKKAGEALFFLPEDPGHGWLLRSESGVAIVKTHDSQLHGDAVRAFFAGQPALPPVGVMPLEGRLMIFDAACSGRQISEVNWGQGSLVTAASEAFAAAAAGPLRVMGQQYPCVGFVRLPAGEYTYSVAEVHEPLMSVFTMERL